MLEKDLDKVLNYMKQYVENKYEHNSEPMLTWKDLKLVLNEIERLNKENKILRENAEHNDKVVDKVNWENKRLNNIINELEKWLVESIEKHTEDYLDWKYDRNVYLAGSEKLQNVFDKLQELKGADK